jgi:hypothetical protein
MVIERRKNPRYCVRDNAFAVFGPEPVKLAPIIDISLGGLGIEVNGNNLCADESNCAARLEIVIDGGCFYMDNLHFQLLPQYRSFSGNAVQPFQHIYGVKFVDLMTSQQNQLKFFTRSLIGLIIGISIFFTSPAKTDDQNKEITENACARLQNAEIVWDLSKYRWMCCIIKNEDEYETCMPITDMQPLPKTRRKQFPPNTTKTIKPENQKK